MNNGEYTTRKSRPFLTKIFTMKKSFFIFLLLAITIAVQSQDKTVVSGPLLGHIDLRTAKVWMQYQPGINNIMLRYGVKGTKKNNFKTALFFPELSIYHNIVVYELVGLEPGTTYEYHLVSSTNNIIRSAELTTQQLWQWRKAAPDFSFLTGSCAYFNEPVYDRPGKPYGNDSSIFESMAKEKADFMLWLGDNWYTREVDFFSEWGLNERPSRDRSLPVLQNFWKSMPHYAIWDDHDYGWNDADKSYPLKDASRDVFKRFWNNPSYGENGQGVYSRFTWNDVDVFMLDDRWFRSNDRMKDSIDGKPNPEKRMFGKQQMEWLKNALLQSSGNNGISFRIIATGSQVLNPLSPSDCFRHFPAEYAELMQFIADNKINGIIFLTGDKHTSEVIKIERPGAYPLYDITASPLTSGSHAFGGAEKNSPYRILGIENAQNYSRFSFSGDKRNRKLTVEFLGTKGEKLNEWSIMLKDISNVR